ncbi:3-methyladenine DNA glycosylase AlkD [Paenibacillus sp. RC84]
MNFEMVMQELESLGKERTKKIYVSNGAHEPLFGVATGAMKPIAKKIKKNQPLAEELYNSGNYDAMYFCRRNSGPESHDCRGF